MKGRVHEEIERKFLVTSAPPSNDLGQPAPLAQGYLAVGADGTEVRIRRSGPRCTLTVKSGQGMSRHEIETDITPAQFETLWAATTGRRVEKDRFLIPHGDVTVELDVFRGELEGLVVAEVEFPSREAGNAFEPPVWFGDEVTGDPRFLNRNLALDGIPS